MDIKLMDIICCPVCKGELKLTITKQEGTEIYDGELLCRTCNFSYPVKDGIPNLLPPEYHNK